MEEALESRRHLGLAPADIALLRSVDRSFKTPAKGLAGLETLPEEGAPAGGRADVTPDEDADPEGSGCVSATEGLGPEGRADVIVEQGLGVEGGADVTEEGEEACDMGTEETETASVVIPRDEHVSADVITDVETYGEEAEEEQVLVSEEVEDGLTTSDDVGLTAGFDAARSEIAAAVDRWGPTPVEKEQVGLCVPQFSSVFANQR